MKKETEISAAELEVMRVLWESDDAMKVQEICDSLTETEWKYKTVATMLMRMEEKGAVVSEKCGKAYYYTPVLDREAYTDSQTKSFIKRIYNGSAKELAVSLFSGDSLSEEDVEEIRQMFKL